MSILRDLNVYGWEAQENLVLSALISYGNMLMLGASGTGKTWLARRVGQALSIAHADRGKPFEHTMIDGYASNEEDLIGYALPPTHDMMDEAYEKDEPVYMKFVLAPNTIKFAHLVTIDEATRIPRMTQSRYLALMNHDPVDGHDLNVRYIFGAGNPPATYSAAEVLDKALADRWHLIVKAPRFEEMDEADRLAILRMKVMRVEEEPPEKEVCNRLYDLLETARAQFDAIRHGETIDGITKYVDGMLATVNKSIRDDNDDFTTTSQLDGRRASVAVNNIAGLHAIQKAKGHTGTLPDDGLRAFQRSFVHELHGEEPIDPSVLETAHEEHKAMLEDAEARMISEIERVNDPIDQAVKAINIAPQDVASSYVVENYQRIKENSPIEAAAFATLLTGRLVEAGRLDAISRSTHDRIVPEVHQVIKTAASRRLLVDDVHPKASSAKQIAKLAELLDDCRRTPKGRLAIALAMMDISGAGGSNPLDPDSQAIKRFSEYVSSIQSAESLVGRVSKKIASIEA